MARWQSLYDWCQEDIQNRVYLLEEWNTERNEQELGLTPNKVAKGSNKYAFWICRKCNYNWKSTIVNRTRTQGSGCPCCAGKQIQQGFNDLATTNPELLTEWDYKSNNKLGITPYNVTKGSRTYVYWTCRRCSYNWKARIQSRVQRGNGCPNCNNKNKSTVKQYEDSLEYLYPNLMEEWDYKKNKEIGLDPSKLYPSSKKYAYWVCKNCNYSWRAIIQSRTRQGSGCSNCNDKSRTEELVRDILTELNVPYERERKQYIRHHKRYYDFFLYDNRLVIEVDGLQHFKYFVANYFANYFDGDIKADNDKNDYLLQVRTPLLRLPGLDTLNWLRQQVGLKTISIDKFKPILKKYIVNFINTRKIPFDIIQDYKIHSNTNYYEVALKMNEMEDKRNANEL